jgi:hypothetical protein
MRTRIEVEKEIAALKALKPVGWHKQQTAEIIAVAVEELKYGVDQTAEEWNELTDSQRDAVREAIAWRDGEKDVPSEGWGGLVARL